MQARHKVALVVDDHSSMRILLSCTVQKAGFIPVCCSSAEDAVAAIIVNPSVIILDYQLGEVDGISLLKKLKSQTVTQAIPIIFVSADGQTSTSTAALTAGASAFLTKPFSPRQLIGLIRQVTGSAK